MSSCRGNEGVNKERSHRWLCDPEQGSPNGLQGNRVLNNNFCPSADNTGCVLIRGRMQQGDLKTNLYKLSVYTNVIKIK